MGTEGGGWGREGRGEVACEEGREVGRRSGGGGTRGTQVWGKRGKAREGHEETSREVAYSEDVRLEVRVLHILQPADICCQARTKRLAAIHCAARVAFTYVTPVVGSPCTLWRGGF